MLHRYTNYTEKLKSDKIIFTFSQQEKLEESSNQVLPSDPRIPFFKPMTLQCDCLLSVKKALE